MAAVGFYLTLNLVPLPSDSCWRHKTPSLNYPSKHTLLLGEITVIIHPLVAIRGSETLRLEKHLGLVLYCVISILMVWCHQTGRKECKKGKFEVPESQRHKTSSFSFELISSLCSTFTHLKKKKKSVKGRNTLTPPRTNINSSRTQKQNTSPATSWLMYFLIPHMFDFFPTSSSS